MKNNIGCARILYVFLSVSALAGWPMRSAEAVVYQYHVLYGPGSGPVFEEVTEPSLNDAGVVAFKARITSQDAIVSGNGGPTTTIAIAGSSFSAFGSYPAINNANQVVFSANRTGGLPGIFRGDGSAAPIAMNGSLTGNFTQNLGVAAINDSGQVAFYGQNGSATNIYVGDGTSLTMVPNGSSGNDLNKSGSVAFAEPGKITRWNGGATTTIAANGSTFSSLGVSPGINDLGAVVFSARLAANDRAVLAVGNGTTTTIIASTGPGSAFTQIRDEPGINNQGDVVFQGVVGGKVGLFVGPDPIADRVLSIGMPLFGATLEAFTFYRHGFNNNGEIAFRYALSNGQGGVAIATPVPEPSSLILAVAAFAAFMGFSRNRIHPRKQKLPRRLRVIGVATVGDVNRVDGDRGGRTQLRA